MACRRRPPGYGSDGHYCRWLRPPGKTPSTQARHDATGRLLAKAATIPHASRAGQCKDQCEKSPKAAWWAIRQDLTGRRGPQGVQQAPTAGGHPPLTAPAWCWPPDVNSPHLPPHGSSGRKSAAVCRRVGAWGGQHVLDLVAGWASSQPAQLDRLGTATCGCRLEPASRPAHRRAWPCQP